MNTQTLIFLCAILTGFCSIRCTTIESPPVITPPLAKVNAPVKHPLDLSLEKIESIAPSSTHKGELVRDIKFFLRAKLLEEQGDKKGAIQNYKEALGASRGIFSKTIFENWLIAYAGQLPEKVSDEILARLVLAELGDAYRPEYFTRAGLTKEDVLQREIRRLVPQNLIQSKPDGNLKAAPKLDAMVLSEDIKVFSAAVKLECNRLNAEPEPQIKHTFSPALLLAWNGSIQQCKGLDNMAAETFDKLLGRRDQAELGLGHYWFASHQRIQTLKGVGKRQAASDEYLRLMKIWQEGKLTAKSLAMDSDEFMLQRINDALWAARYRALTADLSGAKYFAMMALQWINKANAGISREAVKQLVEYKAEAYHVLSSRIAVELHKYDEALTYSTLGYEIPELETEWQDRFAWNMGLYSYLMGNQDAALRYWENLFGNTKNESLKPQLYFWLAKLHYDAGRQQEGDFYFHTLTDEHPLSYYSVVAPELAGFASPDRWKAAFQPLDKLNQNLMSVERFELDPIRQDPSVADILMRAEVVLAATLDDQITHPCINELWRTLQNKIRLSDQSHAIYVYLSRLQYVANQYVESISLTTQMSGGSRSFWLEWPDQIKVYFPQPYADIFAISSDLSGVPIEILMAISRQETSFRPKVTSAAGAIGMMQLIPSTARRMATEVGLDEFEIESQLKDPRINTVLGSAYLKFLDRYYKGFKPAVYAAYNAGEFAVDQWLERRNHSESVGFIEMIPFSETKSYVRNVMRNVKVYQFLASSSETWTFEKSQRNAWLFNVLHM